MSEENSKKWIHFIICCLVLVILTLIEIYLIGYYPLILAIIMIILTILFVLFCWILPVLIWIKEKIN